MKNLIYHLETINNTFDYNYTFGASIVTKVVHVIFIIWWLTSPEYIFLNQAMKICIESGLWFYGDLFKYGRKVAGLEKILQLCTLLKIEPEWSKFKFLVLRYSQWYYPKYSRFPCIEYWGFYFEDSEFIL